MPSLADLTAIRTKEQEFELLRSVWANLGFPVTDWYVGGAARTMGEAIATALADMSVLVKTVAEGGYVETAKLLTDPTWLDLLAEYFYAFQRVRATFTRQRVKITCAVGSGPQTVNTGFIVRAPTNGNRYIFQGSATVVPDGNSVKIDFTAENPGSRYNDAAGSIVEIVTPLPGLSAINENETFGGLETTGVAKKDATNQGTGSVTPSGSPLLARQYTIRILVSGNAGASGTVRIEYVANGVKTTNDLTPIPASTTITGDNVTLTFANGAGTGFVVGDLHTFQAPGTPIVAQGTDDETNTDLAKRCLGRWPSLSLNIVQDKYVAWVQQCSKDNGFGIEKITPRASSTVAGETDILLATASGAPSGSTITAIQNYLNARDGITDKANVAGAVNKNVTLSGSVTVKNADVTAVKLKADELWKAYVAALPIGGDVNTGSPGVVRLKELEQALMDAGAIDLSGIQLNGAAVNLALLYNEVAVIPAGQEPSAALTWNTVA